MKKTRLIAVAVMTALGLMSCRKGTIETVDDQQGANSEMAVLTVNVKGNFSTKASPDVATRNNEDLLSSVEVFVFDARPASPGLGMLEAYEKETGTTNTATVQMHTSTGLKHIYVVANSGSNSAVATSPVLAETIVTEASLKEAISELGDNARGDFIMVGSASPELAAGSASVNKVTIDLKRLVARVKVGTITGAFTSPALRNSEFKVKRIYLMNIPKQAKYVNGDVTDVFGASGSTAIAAGSTGYPTRFIPSGSLDYYFYTAPQASASTASGMYAFMEKSAYSQTALDNLLNGEPPAIKDLTLSDYGAGKYLFVSSTSSNTLVSADHKLTADLDFFTYPNSSAPAASMEDVDNTTKVIIETELEWNGAKTTYYYPISIPYVQPNYAYTIGDVRIKRLGSTDPFTPVSTAECTFTIKVRPWDQGDINGEFNNESSADDFII
ncbi:MAG: DUF4906 domain-containing protein [Bacteroidales bacterium]|nr:DUF4906 domain-containing protein [Bacteroidales bacterium]